MAVTGGTKYIKEETEAAVPVLSSHKSKRIAPNERPNSNQRNATINRELHSICTPPVAPANTANTSPLARYWYAVPL